MNIFFDARYTRTDYHDGISRYSAELGNALARLDDVTFLISNDGQKKWFPKTAQFIKIHSGTSLKEPWTARILNKYAPDIVYSPMQTMGLSGKKFKAILTIHDLIYYRHRTPPQNLPAHIRLGWRAYHLSYWPQRLVLRSADAIATVSEASARDLATTRMTARPVITVLNAPQRFTKYPVKHNGVIKNIVYMGSFMPYKNVETLIKGMQWLPGRTLHLLSKISPQRQAELQAIAPKNTSIVFHNGVSDDTYEQLLADNATLATASQDEGYGIPVAEALAMGVPAVVSNIPVFHEVGAGGALYFNPNKPKTFADAVKQLDDTQFRDEHIKLGQAHMRTFDWGTSAQVLHNAMKSLLDK
jgi:glycosyltransferase involved in cell wall biosynthesis